MYQLPAAVLPGVTLVISPLLALMRDQINHLTNRFKLTAVSVNSDQSAEENENAIESVRQGKTKILFIAPERLDDLNLFEFVQSLNIDLFVIDEAHCISTWGHDFRPSYRQIVHALHRLSQREHPPRVLALTATANETTERDIADQLSAAHGRGLCVKRSSMNRANLQLAVMPVAGLGDKLAYLADLLSELKGTALLYCATRERSETVAQYLQQQGMNALAYHAGIASEKKIQLQHDFIHNQVQIIAATNALGMGIDKPDIRLIVHVDMPGSITAYYQEVGRAGRDGQLAHGILLYDKKDRDIQDYFIRNAQPAPDDFRLILSSLKPGADGQSPKLTQIKTRTGLHPTRVSVVMAELIEQGFVAKQRVKNSQVYLSLARNDVPDLTRYERQLKVRQTELNQMITYCEDANRCYMQVLRDCLGEDKPGKCAHCATCAPDLWAKQLIQPDSKQAWAWTSRREIPIAASKYPPMAEGQSVVSAEVGSPWFTTFMRQRQKMTDLDIELLNFTLSRVNSLTWKHRFGAIVVVPSQSWLQRESTANRIAEKLQLPLLLDELFWSPPPRHRQGQLKNNDQRRQNVKGRMMCEGRIDLPNHTALLVLDDYIGSGATFKEAGRVLTQQLGKKQIIVPFSVARVRWRLGAAGMVNY